VGLRIGRQLRRNAAFHYCGFPTIVTDLGSLTRSYGNRCVVDRAVSGVVTRLLFVRRDAVFATWVIPLRTTVLTSWVAARPGSRSAAMARRDPPCRRCQVPRAPSR
jgi:hypothetical protein